MKITKLINEAANLGACDFAIYQLSNCKSYEEFKKLEDIFNFIYWATNHELIPNIFIKDYKATEKSAFEAYKAIQQPAWEAYEATKQSALEAYKATKQSAREAYEATDKPAWEAYEATQQSARKAYEAIQQPAREAYEATKQSAKIDMFNKIQEWIENQ